MKKDMMKAWSEKLIGLDRHRPTETINGNCWPTRAGMKRRGPRSELVEPSGAMFVLILDRSTT